MKDIKNRKLNYAPNPPSESLADLNMTPIPLGQLNEEFKKFDPDGKKAMALAKKYSKKVDKGK